MGAEVAIDMDSHKANAAVAKDELLKMACIGRWGGRWGCKSKKQKQFICTIVSWAYVQAV